MNIKTVKCHKAKNEYANGMIEQYHFLVALENIVRYANERNGPKVDMTHIIRALSEQAKECLAEANGKGEYPHTGDLREDWDGIPDALNKLRQHMDNSFPSYDGMTDDEAEMAWAEFEETPITLGYGDRLVVLPNCASVHNALTYALKDIEDEET